MEPLYLYVDIATTPSLQVSASDPRIHFITVTQAVRFEAWSQGQNVNEKVKWVVDSRVRATDPTGIMAPDGHYVAPSQPSQVYIGVGSSGPVTYLGGWNVDVLAAPQIDAFTADRTVIAAGQPVQLTAAFREGKGQILMGGQVLFPEVVSGTPVTVSPQATTTCTLRVTNAAGAFLDRDLGISVQ